MSGVHWRRLAAPHLGLLALACGGGGGGGTEPPGPPTQLVKNAGDAQSWYFDNPLPAPLSVKALDANNRPVPGVVVNWEVTAGGGGVNAAQSTTGASGVASTTDSLGSSSPQTVTATPALSSLPTVTFTATAGAPPTSAAVSLTGVRFVPATVVVQVNDSVTWTWNDAPNIHNIVFTSGPESHPADAPNNTMGTYKGGFTAVGTYHYTCTNHMGMDGTVIVVH